MTDFIKLVIADDEPLIRDGLKIMLESLQDIQVVGLAANGQEAFDLCRQHQPDVVLMDIRMPQLNGIEGTRLIKGAYPGIAVLILTTFQDRDYITQAMQLGAAGYLLKDSDYQEIHHGIHLALSGKIVMDQTVTANLITTMPAADTKPSLPADLDLSAKDRQLLRLVAKGYNNKEIAQSLYLSEGTIKNNISQLLLKVGVRDRTQLAIFAHEHHLN
ncbi:response regulator transcription factor [Vaginisenegalia massiliensis]|uniref:response regulator transcription factor n=1 Tax=Vaginisenegalia massiliensis TaxID=2058294 RepID=UPI000F54A8D4|nr:response regulator transcription factor [Vaginisenegalia massiliensis]